MGKLFAAAFAAMLAVASAARAELTEDQAQALVAGLHPHQGTIPLPDAHATITTGAAYDLLDKADARRVVIELWGNPPEMAGNLQGLLLPHGMDLRDPGAWGAVITYMQTFYVSDHEVGKNDYDKLLGEMREGEADENEARQKAGFSTVHLVGWAEAPTYDRARHDLIWAREVKFSDADHDTLNYDVRHLGRNGVLSLNIVGDMDQLAQIHDAARGVAATAEFDPGARYADHQMFDKKAGYGLVGLVAAGAGLAVAQKAGLFALVLLFLKKGIVLVVAAGAAAANWIRRRLGMRPKAPAPAPSAIVAEETRGD